jgi:hypothetical protein
MCYNKFSKNSCTHTIIVFSIIILSNKFVKLCLLVFKNVDKIPYGKFYIIFFFCFSIHTVKYF